MSVQVLCPFFNWIVCLPGVELCEVFIYFGDQTLVWDIIGKYIFPYIWFPFRFKHYKKVNEWKNLQCSNLPSSVNVLLMFSLAMQKLFILMRSHLFILPFMSLALGDILMKVLQCGISEIFLSIFSTRTFMVSHTESPEIYERMLSITSHPRDAN